ncbi:F-box only protein 8 [Leptonychotes weddellii]|uniref:F-box only protein 8 n=1 Tax=Leptonychotes weddellii TaxID=9713 RepID=A0A2U3XD85_LEPWE|nr:F-box only protein 8 [Leptonychotes weddellii]
MRPEIATGTQPSAASHCDRTLAPGRTPRVDRLYLNSGSKPATRRGKTLQAAGSSVLHDSSLQIPHHGWPFSLVSMECGVPQGGGLKYAAVAVVDYQGFELCKSTWGHCSIYNKNPPLGFSFRKLYMQLDEGSLTFNANPEEGVNYFMSKGILDDSPKEIAKFIFCTRTLNWKKLRIYLDERRDVLDDLVTLHNFRNQFLPNALREFFRHIHAPEERGEYLETLITKFSHRFCACNPDLMRELGLSPDAVYVLCYSLILLSIDLTSPHVKNKMSKREFIRNTRRAAQNISEDFVGHLYDNIYLIGHVAA